MKRKAWIVAGMAGLAAIGAVVAVSGTTQATPAPQAPPANTAKVEAGPLSSMVSLDGTLIYRARPNGSPYSVINRAGGTYTQLPGEGRRFACGDVLYRVDDEPVVLMCGAVPAYRDLRRGDEGRDVRQLNRNLHGLGYGAEPGDRRFTWHTTEAVRAFQRDRGLDETGELQVVFLPRPGRIAKVTGELGGAARPGTQVAQATSDTLEVQVALAASQQGEVRKGDRARITLPGNRSATGTVARLARVARSAGQEADPGAATIPASIKLDKAEAVRGLDRAPVQVEIRTEGVKHALSVPVTALVGKSGGGYAVEVVGSGRRRELVAVKLGLFDTGEGRVAVDGDLDAGDDVVVPSL